MAIPDANNRDISQYIDQIKSADIKEVAKQIEQNKASIKHHEEQKQLSIEKLEISKEAMELHIRSYENKYLNAPEAAAEGSERSEETEVIAPPVQDSEPAEGGGAHEVGEDLEEVKEEY